EELVARDRAIVELLLAIAPRLLAVGGEEVGEPRSPVARQGPADDGERVAAVGTRARQILVGDLPDGAFAEGFVAFVLAANRIDDVSHEWLPTTRAARQT